MSQVSSTRKLVGAGAVMASGTMISRILGVIRVMLIAFILGNGTRQADMLALATMVPNSLYILFAGGALNTVLVPQIVRAIKNDDDGGEAYTNRIVTAFMLIITTVAVLQEMLEGWPELKQATVIAQLQKALEQYDFDAAAQALSQL